MFRRIVTHIASKSTASTQQPARKFLTFKPIKKPDAFSDFDQLVEVTSTQAKRAEKVDELLALQNELKQQGINSPLLEKDLFGQVLTNPKVITTEKSMLNRATPSKKI